MFLFEITKVPRKLNFDQELLNIDGTVEKLMPILAISSGPVRIFYFRGNALYIYISIYRYIDIYIYIYAYSSISV